MNAHDLPMIITNPTAIIAAVGTASVVLSYASISNIYETYALVQQRRQQLQLSRDATLRSSAVSEATAWKSADECLEGLLKMSRKDLVDLFLHCEAPDVRDLAFIDGVDADQHWEYDGFLLDNGPILTPVTNFITNRLFGRGRPWVGKVFSASGVGQNRFHDRPPEGDLLDRKFDYSIGKSALLSGSSKSLFLRYAPHSRNLIWRGMVDELRVVPLDTKSGQSTKALLLGMGCFNWSCGEFNSSPFCLVARKCEKKQQ
ncbi:hypothetical protein ACHAWF_011797 [Thalassiosira exigua]